MIPQQNTKQLTEDQKFQQNVQTWHEPAIHTLEKFLEIRKANLRKRNDDESKAAVTRHELMQALHDEHRITIWYAGEIVSSLKRAGRIHCFGSFIDLNLPKKEDHAREMVAKPINLKENEVRGIKDGSKSLICRAIKPEELAVLSHMHKLSKNKEDHSYFRHICPFGQIGEYLWVRETWSHSSYPFQKFDAETDVPFYRADYVDSEFSENGNPDKSVFGMKRNWIPSTHMPRSASRFLLEITDIHVRQDSHDLFGEESIEWVLKIRVVSHAQGGAV